MCCPLTLVTIVSFISVVSSGFSNDSSLVLYKNTDPHRNSLNVIYREKSPPFVIAPVPDQELTTLSDPLVIPLLDVFSTNDNSPLSFEVAVNNGNIADADISNDTLYVKPEQPGNARIRIIARDNDDDSAVDAFRISVRENSPPQIAQDIPVRDQVLIQGDAPLTLNLFTLFFDPDGDVLDFSVTSSNLVVSRPAIERGVLTAPASQPGSTLLTVLADDLFGGQTSVQFELEVLRPYQEEMTSGLSLDFGPINESTSYRLIALPGNQSVRINDLAIGDVNKDWITFASDSLVESGLLPYNLTDAFLLRPGNGLWFLSTQPWILPEQTIPTVPLTQGGTYRIPLHSGWNIISNPFDTDLLWEDVATWNDVSQAIWSWNGRYALADTFYAAVNKGEAFYYFNAEARTFLDLPYPGFANPLFFKSDQKSSFDVIRLSAAAAHESLATIEAGFSPDANVGSDHFDYYAPPSVFSELDLHILNEHPTLDGRALARDILPADQPLKRYKISLRASPGVPVQLVADTKNISYFEKILLVNEHDGASYDLNSLSNVWITPEKETTPFTLLIGEPSIVDNEVSRIKPKLYTLKQNFPNPFNASTIIEFSLPDELHVTLKVFDSSGRLVDVLIDKSLEAGLHQIAWTPTDKKLANGVYLYRLNTGTITLHRTMVLLK